MPEVKPAPAVEPLPAPAPTPSIVQPTSVQSQTEAQRRKAVQNMRYGLLSTIKTSSKGVTSGPDIYTPSAGGLKQKMGQ